MRTKRPIVLTWICLSLLLFSATAGFAAEGLSSSITGAIGDALTKKDASGQSGQAGEELDEPTINAGLADALELAVDRSVSTLGQQNGYLDNPLAKIPLPESLQIPAKALKAVGQEHLVTDFVVSMNRAAEKAVPETTSIFMDAIQAMTMQDGRAILNGPDDAATRYFERTKRPELRERVIPIIEESLAEAEVVQYYEAMTGAAKSASPMVGSYGVNLKDYVTEKGLDGLFAQMAEYEQKVRENVAFRTTDVMQQVFGVLD